LCTFVLALVSCKRPRVYLCSSDSWLKCFIQQTLRLDLYSPLKTSCKPQAGTCAGEEHPMVLHSGWLPPLSLSWEPPPYPSRYSPDPSLSSAPPRSRRPLSSSSSSVQSAERLRGRPRPREPWRRWTFRRAARVLTRVRKKKTASG